MNEATQTASLRYGRRDPFRNPTNPFRFSELLFAPPYEEYMTKRRNNLNLGSSPKR